MIRRTIQIQAQQFAKAAGMKMRPAAGCSALICPSMQCTDRRQQQYGKNRFALVL